MKIETNINKPNNIYTKAWKEMNLKEKMYIIHKWCVTILMILSIPLALLLLINQGLMWHYNIDLLTNPCDICQVANKPQAKCISQCFSFQSNGLEKINYSNIQTEYIPIK